ncbi:MAG: glycosyltransferase family 39 protein [Crocinitomicaceae bacterium]|nr:glycosyltransferase family 39 protein [Crocinitomicaceae bacterium]
MTIKSNVFVWSFGILILNLIIKFVFIDYPPIGGDEPFTIFFAQSDFTTLYEMFQTENNPPLYTLLLKVWISFFGISPLSVRFLPTIFSSLTAVALFNFGTKNFNFRTGILTSLIFTFSSYHIFFAHETRPYALFGLLSVVSMITFFNLKREFSRKNIFLLSLFNSLLIYTHFFGFFMLFVQLLSLCFDSEFKLNWKRYFISWTLTAILYTPYLSLLFFRFGQASKGTWVDEPTITELYNNLWKFSNQPLNTVLFLTILVTALVFFIIRKEKFHHASWTLIIWFLGMYFLMFGLSFKIPMFLDRYLVYISFAYYFLIALSVDYIFKHKRWKNIITVVIAILMVVTTNLRAGNERKHDEIADFVRLKASKQTPIILCPDWYFRTLSYHYNKKYFIDYKNTISCLKAENIHPANNFEELSNSNLEDSDTLIFIDTGSKLVDPEGHLFNQLSTSRKIIGKNQDYQAITIFTLIKD